MRTPPHVRPKRAALAADVATFGFDPDAELCVVELLRTARDLEAVFTAELAPYGLSLSRFGILMELRTAGEHQLSLTVLGHRLVVVPSNVTKQVDALEVRGLVKRVPSPVDRRASFVRLTTEGSALLERILPDHYAGQMRLLAHLSAAERTSLMRLLGAVQRGAKERRMQDAAEAGRMPDVGPIPNSRQKPPGRQRAAVG
jgi:DNA-binding MarR family transcriptional regulator